MATITYDGVEYDSLQEAYEQAIERIDDGTINVGEPIYVTDIVISEDCEFGFKVEGE